MEDTRFQTLWLVLLCFSVCLAFNGCFANCKVFKGLSDTFKATDERVFDKQSRTQANQTSSNSIMTLSNSTGIERNDSPHLYHGLDRVSSIETEIMEKKGLPLSVDNEESSLYQFLYDTSDTVEGNQDLTDDFEMINFRRRSLYDRLVMNDRLKRHIFGKDNRMHVPPSTTQRFPFSAVVRLLSGCTGTLIWYKHVLTSAHCVHDGTNYIPLSKLKVGILRGTSTFKWFDVRKVHVANQWFRKKGFRKLGHDYAVIELKKKHGRPYMSFGSHPSRAGRSIQFAGFPDDKEINQMWFTQCTIMKHTKRILYNICDAWPGMSGSGVYVYDKRPFVIANRNNYNRKVVAIFSSFRARIGKNGKYLQGHNIATRLTKKKVERICHWIKAGRGCQFLRKWIVDGNGMPRICMQTKKPLSFITCNVYSDTLVTASLHGVLASPVDGTCRHTEAHYFGECW